MKAEECVKGLKFLGVAYNKEFDEEECKVYYEFLQIYSYDTFKTSIKSIIKKSKFIPKINELIEECEEHSKKKGFAIIDYMRSKGYFKETSEYDKAIMYLESNIVPTWFKNDIKEYMESKNKEELEYKEQKQLGV